jgi:hypothetical protein
MLADIANPRDPRGVRHPLVAVLGVAVVATLAGAVNYRVPCPQPSGLRTRVGFVPER